MRLIVAASLIVVMTSGCGGSHSTPGGAGGAAGDATGTGTGGATGGSTGSGIGGAAGGSTGTGIGGASGSAGTTGTGGTGGMPAGDLPLCGPCALDTDCAAPNVCGRTARSAQLAFCTPAGKTTRCCTGDSVQVCFTADGTLNLPKLQCASPKPAPAASITDFSNVDSATGNFATSGLTGYVFTLSGLTRDLSAGTLHVAGSVATYAAFGVAFDCVDASKYSGISFKISGNPGASGMLSVAVDTDADTLREQGGTCVAEPAMCLPPGKNIAVGAGTTTVSVAWADLTGGMPRSSVDTTRMHAVVWGFAYAPSSYAVDVTVDDLAFW